jgi:CheY-like chemotaxis protein
MPQQANLLDSYQDGLAVTRAAKPRLLVIGDDKLHRMMICRMAAKAGYLPAGAATYEEAAKLWQETAFDCITLDLTLGARNGDEMLRYLWVAGCKAPIIMIGNCDDATREASMKIAEWLDLNIRGSIPKPVDLDVLRTWLDQLKD